jgi:hypothetical protein
VVRAISTEANWIMVDGGQYQAAILAPTINGVVLPTLSISLATLVAQTINALRQRENKIRTCLNNEISDMRTLQAAVEGAFGGSMKLREEKYNILILLSVYTSRIYTELFSKSTTQLRSLNKIL